MRSLTAMMGILIVVAVNGSGQSKDGAAAALAPVPSDIIPDSLSRLPLVKRGDLDEAGKKVFDSSAGPEGRMSGPAALALYSPQMAEPIESLNRWLRRNGVLDRALPNSPFWLQPGRSISVMNGAMNRRLCEWA